MTPKFKIGDRVEFVRDYSQHGGPLGARGVVVGYNCDCVNVVLDDGTTPAPVAEFRLVLLPTTEPPRAPGFHNIHIRTVKNGYFVSVDTEPGLLGDTYVFRSAVALGKWIEKNAGYYEE